MRAKSSERRSAFTRRANASSSRSGKSTRPPRQLRRKSRLPGGFFVGARNAGDRIDSMIKIGIVGGTGYTGVELLRILARHPQAELRAITSRGEAGTPVAKMF